MTDPQSNWWRRLDQTGLPLLGARLILGLTFIWMGWSKAAKPVEFLKLIREYELIPDGAYLLLNTTAIVLPWLEILCGLLLLLGVWIRGSALALGVMLVGFTTAIVIRTAKEYAAGGIALCDIKFDCGCGSGEVYICPKVLMNIGLLLLALLALASRSRRFCLTGPGAASQVSPQVAARPDAA